MNNVRLVARLDIKAPNLVKGIQFEGLRKLGNPREFATKYYEQGIDEIIYVDIVASLYERNSLSNLIKESTNDIFVPLTVGGGLRTIDDIRTTLQSGADKVAINTAAIKNPKIISDVADRFGSQCMVLSIQAKKTDEGKWEAYYDNGREHTGIDVIEWAKKGYEFGAGEILVTSVDRDGTKKGFDTELVQKIADLVPIPVIACGGFGKKSDLVDIIKTGHADAVAIGSSLHYNEHSIRELKEYAISEGINMRLC